LRRDCIYRTGALPVLRGIRLFYSPVAQQALLRLVRSVLAVPCFIPKTARKQEGDPALSLATSPTSTNVNLMPETLPEWAAPEMSDV